MLVADIALSGARVMWELDAVISRRARPGTIVDDSGTDFKPTGILSWCQRTETSWHYIAAVKPIHSGLIESFNVRF